MANFIYPAGTPSGTVPVAYVLPESDWQTNIQQVFKSANFTDGSTHSPSAFVTVGGSGFELTGTGHSLASSARLNVETSAEIRLKNGSTLRADGSTSDITLAVVSNVATLTTQTAAVADLGGTTNFTGAANWASPGTAVFATATSATFQAGSFLILADNATATLGGDVNVSSTGIVTFQNGSNVGSGATAFAQWSGTWWNAGPVTFVSGASLTGNSGVNATWAGTWSFGSTLGVTGATTLSSTLAVTGATTLSSTLAVSGVSTFSNRVARSGTAAYAELRVGDGPDSSTSIDAYEKDVWTSAITSNRTWTLNAGPTGKAFIAYFVAPSLYQLTITSATFSEVLSRILASGNYKSIAALWTGTEWICFPGLTV